MPPAPKRTPADVAGLFKLLGDPTRALILLELGAGEGPRDTTALVAAVGRHQTQVSQNLTRLRAAGLVETTVAGARRVHALTPAGRVLAEAIERLSEHR
jgi:DNA-binding transcriptional ArsR family regulator